MARSHNSRTPRPVGEPAPADAIQLAVTTKTMSVEPEAAPADRNEHADTPGHPRARGTLPMARHLIDLAIEEEIQRHARTAPRMTVDQAIRIARLVGWNEPPTDREAGRRTDHAA